MSPQLQEALLALVRRAGEAILPYWRQSIAVDRKADASPVTAADLAAHHILLEGLRALAPDVPVLSEEACDLPLTTRQGWTRWWLVDPLDGTKEFLAGTEEFTVNVALIEHGRAVFGVVGIPASGRCYYGGAGIGAWQADPGQVPRALTVRHRQAPPFTVVASRRHSSPAQERLLAGLGEELGELALASIGSSLKFCLLAEGAADCYPRLSPTSQWDTAAAQAVLEGAGGEVLQVDGQPLRYEAHEDFLNPGFLALPRAIDWKPTLLAIAARARNG